MIAPNFMGPHNHDEMLSCHLGRIKNPYWLEQADHRVV